MGFDRSIDYKGSNVNYKYDINNLKLILHVTYFTLTGLYQTAEK